MEVTNKRVLVFGSGISGIGAAGLLEDQGAQVVLYDGNEKLKEEEVRGKLREGSRVQIVIGSFPEELLCSLDIVVLSPGVPTDLPVVEQMRERGILITGEVELAYEAGRGDVLAITGTNGKTTTTALLGEIMENYCRKVFVVGNIGNPYTTAASQMDDDTDHLNRHHTMEAYVNAKKNIARNQTEEDYCILNYEDELTREFGENIRAQVLYFSSRRKLEQGICLEDGNIVYRRDKEVLICNVEELKLLGTHNYENVMAAAAMALVYGVPPQIVRQSVKAFQGVEHRIEFVTEKNGVTYYNDSKGTNPDAAIKGIQAMKRPTVLIGGGYDKDSVYTEWINSFEGKVRKLVLTGATKEKIAADARACGFEDYVFTDTFEEAVLEAARTAREGEAVLLSPACASWDMFPSYEVRGEKFKEIVNSL